MHKEVNYNSKDNQKIEEYSTKNEDIKDKIIKNLQSRLKMAEEDKESCDYLEGLYDAINIAKSTKI